MAKELVERIQAGGIQLWVADGQLRFKAPTGALTTDLRHELLSHKVEVIAYLSGAGDTTAPGFPDIQATPRDATLPLSASQERLWFINRLEPDSIAYNVGRAYRAEGALNIAALKQAVHTVIRRHEVLRTTFAAHDGMPHQIIAADSMIDIPTVDMRGTDSADDVAAAFLAGGLERRYDLSRGPLIRCQAYRTGNARWAFAIDMHHIVTDGWSIGVLNRELSAAYEACVAGFPLRLQALPIQYVDFAVWQRKWIVADVVRSQLQFWEKNLAGIKPFEFPRDHDRPSLPCYDADHVTIAIPKSLLDELKTLCRRNGATINMAFLGVLKILGSRYTGMTDIAVGSLVAARNRLEIENLIGFFVNTLVLRTNLDRDPGFCEVLQRVRRTILDAYDNQDVPFERLVEKLQPERRVNMNPLCQILYSYQNFAEMSLTLTGTRVDRLKISSTTIRFDLEIFVRNAVDGITIDWVYNTALFERDTIEKMADHYLRILTSVVRNPELRMSEISVLSAAEYRLIISEWNRREPASKATDGDYTEVRKPPIGRRQKPQNVWHLFAQQVREFPDRVALTVREQSFSFSQLQRMSGAVAYVLSQNGVAVDASVGIFAERSVELVAGILGTLRGGAGYVPLDPAYPGERLAMMVEDADVRLILTTGNLREQLPATDADIVLLDHHIGCGKTHRLDNRHTRVVQQRAVTVAAQNTAYVIFTSGSTGRPKGVAMPHGALGNLVHWQVSQPAMRTPPRTLQFASYSFDVSFQEMLSTWSAGGTLLMVDEDTRRDPADLLNFIVRCSVEHVFFPFVVLQQLSDALEKTTMSLHGLKTVTTAGDRLQLTQSIQSLFGQHADCRLYNHYGPSESHVVTAFAVTDPDKTTDLLPPIGRPIDNTRIFILDRDLNPVPVGVPGELCIGGMCLARGYVNRPEQTAQRFIPDPFGAEPGARIYRTGDLARYRRDGVIDFLGRIDHQVKIRGYRIEPGEIEVVLCSHPAVSDAVVLVHEYRSDRRLAAYIVLKNRDTCESSDLRQFLKDKVPDYMVPAVIMIMDAFPLTPSGKVDRRNFPAPEVTRSQSDDAFAAPKDSIETRLADLWSEILGVQAIGMDDNFFDLGGHSLLAVRLISAVEREYDITFPLMTFFQEPTVGAMATLVRNTSGEPDSSVGCGEPGQDAEDIAVRWQRGPHARLRSLRIRLRVVGERCSGFLITAAFRICGALVPNHTLKLLVSSLLHLHWVQALFFRGRARTIREFLRPLRGRIDETSFIGDELLRSNWHLWMANGQVSKNVRPDRPPLVTVGDNYLVSAIRDGRGVVVVNVHNQFRVDIEHKLDSYGVGRLDIRGVGRVFRAVGVNVWERPFIKNLNVLRTSAFSQEFLQAGDVLRAGGIVSIMGDVSQGSSEGIDIAVFGRLRNVKSGFAELAIQTNSVVIPAFAERADNNSWIVRFHAPLDAGSEELPDDQRTAALIRQYAAVLEDQWSSYPQAVPFQRMREHVNYPRMPES